MKKPKTNTEKLVEAFKQYRRGCQREHGRVARIWSGVDDREIQTCYVFIELDGGVQAFGGLVLQGESLAWFESDLNWLFGLGAAVLTWAPGETAKAYSLPEQFVGQEVYALRPWGTNNDAIVGLESVATGRVMTIEGWRKRHNLGPSGTPLEEKRKSIFNEIDRLRWQIKDHERRLEKLEEGYVQWDEKGMER